MTFLVLSKSHTSIPIVMENNNEGKKHSVLQIKYNEPETVNQWPFTLEYDRRFLYK